jgi:hypothetical protein
MTVANSQALVIHRRQGDFSLADKTQLENLQTSAKEVCICGFALVVSVSQLFDRKSDSWDQVPKNTHDKITVRNSWQVLSSEIWATS